MLTAPNSATPDATAPTNATRERYPPRSTHDTGSIRASRALSRHECAHLPPALPQRLKTPYSESGEAKRESGEAHSRDARSHETKHTALHQGTHGCTRTLGQATRRGGVNTPQTLDTSRENAPSSTHEIAAHPASESASPHRRKRPAGGNTPPTGHSHQRTVVSRSLGDERAPYGRSYHRTSAGFTITGVVVFSTIRANSSQVRCSPSLVTHTSGSPILKNRLAPISTNVPATSFRVSKVAWSPSTLCAVKSVVGFSS